VADGQGKSLSNWNVDYRMNWLYNANGKTIGTTGKLPVKRFGLWQGSFSPANLPEARPARKKGRWPDE